MIPTYCSGRSDALIRGTAFGRAHRQQVHRTVGTYERLFNDVHGLDTDDVRRLGSLVGERLDAEHPELATEIRAVAEGAEVSPDVLMAVNARTEILAGTRPPECTVIGALPSQKTGSTILAQNWDWHPDLAGSRVLWTVHGHSGRWFTTLTEAGILGKVGLNSRGLGVCLNIMNSSLDGGVSGTPIHVILRLILEDCDDLEDVRALLSTVRASASSCITVGLGSPDKPGLVSFEVSPAGVTAIEPKGGWIAHTNHFLTERRGVDLYRRDWPDTVHRLTEVQDFMSRAPAPLGARDAKSVLRSHHAGPIAVCCHDPRNARYVDQQETLASLVMNLEERRMEISDGAPCTAPYHRYDVPRPEPVE